MANENVDVFQFVALRSPEKLDAARNRWVYVRDDAYVVVDNLSVVAEPSVSPLPAGSLVSGCIDVDLFSPLGPSPLGRLIAEMLFRKRSNRTAVIAAVQKMLVGGLIYGSGSSRISVPPAIQALNLGVQMNAQRGAALLAAGSRPSYTEGAHLYILPESLDDLVLPLSPQLAKAARVFAGWERPVDDPTWRQRLFSTLPTQLGTDSIYDLVFNASGRYEGDFAMTKRILFDTLYGLYILRRQWPVNLEPVLQGLALCHLLEGLAVAEFFEKVLDAGTFAASTGLMRALIGLHPSLADFDPTAGDARKQLAALDLLGPTTPAGLAARLQATPVVHPLMARLDATFAPFNSLKPVGLGDLKVVKETFLGYRKGDIAHIETVLKGEEKTRTHRSLERAEDSFSLSSSTDSENVKDSQSTTRFELKNEAEQVIKTDVGLTANANFSYKGNPVVEASLAAGASFSNSRSATDRSARNFVNEVIGKATSRIQSKVAQDRRQSRISEVEETTVHGFKNNVPGADHISGIYRWLDKVYRGQVYDYGRRLMFEFVLPEPAEFYVEARLHAYTAQLEIPKYPVAGDAPPAPVMPVASPTDINETRYGELARLYDLAAFPYPAETIPDVPLKTLTGEVVFRMQVPYAIGQPGTKTETFSAKLENVPAGYVATAVRLAGTANFAARDELPQFPEVQNTLEMSLNNTRVFYRSDETYAGWSDINVLGTTTRTDLATPEKTYFDLGSGLAVGTDVVVRIFTKTGTAHELTIYLTLSRTGAALQAWQRAVYDEIARKVNQGTATAGSEDLASRRIAYQRALSALKAKSINEIIQGRSEAWNEQQVRRDLKRQCLAMVTKEFDANDSDDLLPPMGGVGTRLTDVLFPVFDVTEGKLVTAGTENVVTEATAKFADVDPAPVSFSAMRIDEAAKRGRFVQFLEQAFEWGQLSYLFYPYFWARMPQWLQLISREDPSDPLFTEFLQAGSARVLLAVKPGYENAVLHFLATREPWSGGPSPVIGDSLYLPLYEEVRNRQDDLAGATPVGESWEFSLPTSLIYLETAGNPLEPMEYKPKS